MAATDTCVFCGASGVDFKPEHWVSQWISRAAIPEGKGIRHHVPGREPWLDRIVDLTVDHVCPSCNHGWMSDLETKVRNVALPLIEGAPEDSVLRKNEQLLLARWCFMKVITLELGRPAYERPTYPREIYSGFRRFKQPPNGCIISVGHREITEDPPLFVWFKSQGRKHALPPNAHLDGYRATLTIKHLVVDIVGVFAAPAIRVDDPDQRLLQIWRYRSDLHWPPVARFTGIEDNDLV